jgi:rhamnosyltransferase
MSAHCTVIIPTKNGMERLPEVLQVVLNQKVPWFYDVIAIDSGSSDDTVEYLKSQKITLIEIRAEDFGHGKTRNQAIAATKAPYVVLITQDAVPVGDQWLNSLVSALEVSPEIAGAFGRHIAHENADPFTARDLKVHFDFFKSQPQVVSKKTDVSRYAQDTAWVEMLHFFSDNNAILRRSVWERIPYPDVDFAEDQLWAKEIIGAGYSKAYVDMAVVRHSHDFSIWEKLQRCFDEARSFRKSFGYSLIPNMTSIPSKFISHVKRDIHDLRTGVVREASPSQIIIQMGMNFALVFGHYLGSNFYQLPQRLQNLLSRDRKLQSII